MSTYERRYPSPSAVVADKLVLLEQIGLDWMDYEVGVRVELVAPGTTVSMSDVESGKMIEFPVRVGFANNTGRVGCKAFSCV